VDETDFVEVDVGLLLIFQCSFFEVEQVSKSLVVYLDVRYTKKESSFGILLVQLKLWERVLESLPR
jgi:hypothetical protein